MVGGGATGGLTEHPETVSGNVLALGRSMNAIDLIMKDHKTLRTLLTRIVNADGEERREELLSQVERRTLTPAEAARMLFEEAWPDPKGDPR